MKGNSLRCAGQTLDEIVEEMHQFKAAHGCSPSSIVVTRNQYRIMLRDAHPSSIQAEPGGPFPPGKFIGVPVVIDADRYISTKERIEQWKRENLVDFKDREPLFIKRLRESGMDDRRVLSVLNVIDNTCLSCYDNDKYCYCTCDD